MNQKTLKYSNYEPQINKNATKDILNMILRM